MNEMEFLDSQNEPTERTFHSFWTLCFFLHMFFQGEKVRGNPHTSTFTDHEVIYNFQHFSKWF